MLGIKNFRSRAGNRIAMWMQEHCGWMPDKQFLQLLFWLKMGYRLNLKHPKTFSEKLQWLKLYHRKPEYTKMVDKLAVKEIVSKTIGAEYVIPTLGVWDRPEEIDWEQLPDRFVLKTTHGGGSGGVVICPDKCKVERDVVVERLNRSLSQDIYRYFREWPYKNVPRRIIAEQFIDPAPDVSDLADYKWFCFSGEPKFCQVIQDRHSKETIDIFDVEWNHQNFVGLNPMAGPAAVVPSRPKNLDVQIEIARKLSQDIPFARIDLYETGENTYFGEVTFYPASGLGSFRPDQYNEMLGQMMKLPGEKMGGAIVELRVESSGLRALDCSKMEVTRPDLRDYKFFCFNGRVECFKIDFSRQVEHHANYYDREAHLLPFGEIMCPPRPEKYLEIPSTLNEMIRLAETLAGNNPFVRVDFYNHNEKVLFGEITFYPASGMGKFAPEEWDKTLGTWMHLPK